MFVYQSLQERSGAIRELLPEELDIISGGTASFDLAPRMIRAPNGRNL